MSNALRMENVVAGYGQTVILNNVSLQVPSGSVVALLGRNGMGKTTLLETIMGFTALQKGEIYFRDEAIQHRRTDHRALAGLGYVPQGREVFPSLTVEEHLRVAHRKGGWTTSAIFDLFPNLGARRRHGGNHLSGGEQQMLAVGRALSGAPQMLLLDEPTEGLAPVMVDAVMDALRQIRQISGITMLLVEHKVDLALSIADEVYVLDRGQVVFHSDASTVHDSDIIERQIMGTVTMPHLLR